MAIFSGPMFEPTEDLFRKSVHGKSGGHYNIFELKDEATGLDLFKQSFPNPSEDISEMNFVLFSTSGVHGSYVSIEEIEAGLAKYGDDPEFPEDVDWPEGWEGNRLTILLVQPRIVGMTYGNVKVKLEDIPYLKALREASWKAVQEIGAYEVQA